MTNKEKAIELLGEKKRCGYYYDDNGCNCPYMGKCDIYDLNKMHSKAVEVVVGLLEKQKMLLEACKAAIDIPADYHLLCDIVEKLSQAIAKAEESQNET